MSPKTKQGRSSSTTSWIADLGRGTELQWAQKFLDILRDGKPRSFNRLVLEASNGQYNASTAGMKPPEYGLWYLVGQGLVEHEQPKGQWGGPITFRLVGSTTTRAEADASWGPAPWPEDPQEDFIVSIPRSAVGASEGTAWQAAINKSGAADEDLHKTAHSDTHWRFVIVPHTKPLPEPHYYEVARRRVIAELRELLQTPKGRALIDYDLLGKVRDVPPWEAVRPHLSKSLVAMLEKPSWEGNRPGLVGYNLRRIAEAHHG